ncbi:MAG: DUF1642 domain-containing protein [Streptococcus sp.]|uniref:DUF1642 domain-containing protein n=1 Tax=Streptococcus sp. TaxID=1306 RepID=UPI00258CEF0C|nr:DUF1642 domain-containing protein [Streptococcus sp.]MCR5051474.1 DUF1642 domain-containing protein [Streptococcus sp.]
MNKQEAIEKIEACKSPFISEDDTIFNYGLDKALSIIKQLDEPEKPVVPQFVAEYIEYCKSNKLTLLGAFDPVSEHGIGLANTFTGVVQKSIDWAKRNQETFAKAWFYGYEVEKEKLYTVKFSNEDFGKIYIGILKKVNKLGISSLPLNDNDVKSWFTEDELKRFKFWNNSAFEVKEVKNDNTKI